jgi:hypothetical protein
VGDLRGKKVQMPRRQISIADADWLRRQEFGLGIPREPEVLLELERLDLSGIRNKIRLVKI